MKKTLLLISSLIIISVSCSDKKDDVPATCTDIEIKNDLVQKNVQIQYEYEFKIPEDLWFFKGFNYGIFIKQICENTAKEKIKAYAPLSNIPLTKEEITEYFIGIADLTPPIPQYEYTGLVFDEEWILDTAKFIMKKKVRSYTLIREYERKMADGESGTVKSLVAKYDFSNNPEKEISGLKLLEKDVTTVVPFNNSDNPEFYNNILVNYTVEVIIDYMLKTKTPAYSFMFRDSVKAIPQADIALRLGQETVKEVVIDEESGETDTVLIDRKIELSEIIGFAFIEDWYLDEETMQIYKEVKAIAPVRQYTKIMSNGEYDTGTSIPFCMYFSNYSPEKK